MKIPILILIVAILLVSGCTQNQQTTSAQKTSSAQTPEKSPSQTQIISSPTTTEKASPTTNTENGFNYESLPKYASRYYRYSKEAYQSALNEGKVIYLYFYANWCPICKEARPKILEAFNKMDFDDVIGFEVHYNDGEEKDFDREITRNYQVPYQHTTIIAKNGGQVFKSLEELSADKLIEEIGKARGS
ncbi:MAG: thioredoxin family protein [Candidatus Aenigmarchaeota archaeon]|nr:thioredoxin family protein [Candidatus Aenigmarchaeota archaeon]